MRPSADNPVGLKVTAGANAAEDSWASAAGAFGRVRAPRRSLRNAAA